MIEVETIFRIKKNGEVVVEINEDELAQLKDFLVSKDGEENIIDFDINQSNMN